jgi:hypothetical protein
MQYVRPSGAWRSDYLDSLHFLLLFQGVKSRKTGESAKAEKSGFIGEFYNFTGRVRTLGGRPCTQAIVALAIAKQWDGYLCTTQG